MGCGVNESKLKDPIEYVETNKCQIITIIKALDSPFPRTLICLHSITEVTPGEGQVTVSRNIKSKLVSTRVSRSSVEAVMRRAG